MSIHGKTGENISHQSDFGKKPSNIAEIRSSLRTKIYDIKELLTQIEQEPDLVNYFPLAKAVMEEFLTNGILTSKKAAFEKLQIHHPELFGILAGAMEEERTKKGLARLKKESGTLPAKTTTPTGIGHFKPGKTKKVSIHNREIKPPSFTKEKNK